MTESSSTSKEQEIINSKPRKFNNIRISSLSGGPITKPKEEKERVKGFTSEQKNNKSHQESPLSGPQSKTFEQGRFNELIQEHVRIL